MTTKSEWQAASQALMADDRRRLGEPPSAEEMLAYTRGELSNEEEARVRERLMPYPELIRTLTAPFPAEGASPGDPDYMNDQEFASHWASLQKRMRKPGGATVLQFKHAFSAIAATLAVVFGALFWQARSELRQPRVAWDQQELTPDGQRGLPEATVLTAEGESVLLYASLTNEPAFGTYYLEILDTAVTPPRSVWRSDPQPRRSNDSFAILVSRSSLKPGKYRVVLYGVNGARQEPLTTYTLRVPGH